MGTLNSISWIRRPQTRLPKTKCNFKINKRKNLSSDQVKSRTAKLKYSRVKKSSPKNAILTAEIYRYQCKIQNLLRKFLKKSQIKKTPRNLNLRISKKLDSNFFSYFFPPLEFFLLATPILKKHFQKMATSTISWKAGKSEK